MSKSKTKREHRELKREKARKQAAHQRRAAAAAKAPNQPPPSKKQKTNPSSAEATATTTTALPAQAPTLKTHTQVSPRSEIPFGVYDNILLVGEGDFSFTKSLAIEHGCANVTATSFDTEEEVRRKYPNFEAVEAELSGLTPPVPLHYGIDATKLASYKSLKAQSNEGEAERGKEGEGWDTVAFMFPHTGGLSTDVNRQVRANQALLVGFFNACLDAPSSAPALKPTPPAKPSDTSSTPPPAPKPPRKPRAPFLKSSGKIIVTLFEGEPYTLWNIRDLARHAGLKVLESWKFDAQEYPGYAHVRTLGAIEGGGGWKGEDRLARMYVFEKIATAGNAESKKKREKSSVKGKKRGRDESGSDSEQG